jgi:hypothetical protein
MNCISLKHPHFVHLYMHVALKMKMWQTMMFTLKIQWKLLVRRENGLILPFCITPTFASWSLWLLQASDLLFTRQNKLPLQILDACGILLPYSHLHINTKQFKKWKVIKLEEFPTVEILLQFLRVQNNHLTSTWNQIHSTQEAELWSWPQQEVFLANVGKIQINLVAIILTSPIVSGNAQGPFFT